MLCSSWSHVVKFSLTSMGAHFSASSLCRIHNNYSTENNWVSQVLRLFFFVWFLGFFLSIRETHQARASDLHCGSFKQLIFLVHLLVPPLASCFHSGSQLGATCERRGTGSGYFKPLPPWAMETTAINIQYRHLTV